MVAPGSVQNLLHTTLRDAGVRLPAGLDAGAGANTATAVTAWSWSWLDSPCI
jgi:hypothetical protein